jgi:hypothetical protein
MKQVRNQKGMTLASMAMLGMLIGFVAYFGFMLYGPVYDDLSVKTVVENLATDSKAKGASAKAVRNLIQKRLSVNRVDVDKKDIVIEKTKEGLSVAIDYEKRVDFVGNVDLIASFSHSIMIPK